VGCWDCDCNDCSFFEKEQGFGLKFDLVDSEEEFVVGVDNEVVKVVEVATVDAMVMVNTVVVAVLEATAVVTVGALVLVTETGTMTTLGLHDETGISLGDLTEGMLSE
jgi:hypothetical protein